MDRDVVRDIEDVSARAWPPLHTGAADGWVLRAGGGVTGRANSVWPRADHGSLTLDGKLAAARDFYAAQGLPLLVQLSPASQPDNLPDALADRGYAVTRGPRSVLTAALAGVVAVGEAGRIQIDSSADDRWYGVVAQVNTSFAEQSAAASALLAGVRQPSAYAVATVDGLPAAAGRGVHDGDWLGVFNMATLPAYRRRGCAAAVLAALAQWALALGASRAYLQMDVTNDAAPKLYEKAGFDHCYEYAFWGKPETR